MGNLDEHWPVWGCQRTRQRRWCILSKRYNNAFGLAAVTDGGNTFFVGEDVPNINAHCDWAFFNHATGTCAIPLNNGFVAGQPGFGNIYDWPDVYSFRSRHSQGANFLLGDGSVRYVRESVDINVYRAMATRQGGEVATLN